MKLAATIARSLQADMQAELRDIERAVASGTRDAGRGLRTELRRQVTSAGLGQRLANSWRDNHYPNRKLEAASLVYTKAPQIVRAFDEGAVIRSKPSLLVVDGLRASYSRQTGDLRGFRRTTDRARERGEGLTMVAMFLLMPQVKLRKRLDVARAAERWSGQLPALIEQQLRSE